MTTEFKGQESIEIGSPKLKNKDYSASAVDLNNDRATQNSLLNWLDAQAAADATRAELEQTELFKLWTIKCEFAAKAKAVVTDAINEFGSYQDVNDGHYAVKQRKLSKQYHAEPFMENFEKFSPAVIELTINTKALEGLVKGKLITEDELKDKGVITTTESYAYIIK